MNHFLVLIIQSRSSFIQHNNRGVSDQSSCNSYPLFLSSWKEWSSGPNFLTKSFQNRIIKQFSFCSIFKMLATFNIVIIFIRGKNLRLIIVFHPKITIYNEIICFGHFTSIYYILQCCIFTIVFNILINWSIE